MQKTQIIKEIINNSSHKEFKTFRNTLEDSGKGIYVILKVIDSAKNEISSSDIANQLDISLARVTMALNKLEEKGLIKKNKDKDDKRKTIVCLTDLGKIKLEEKEQNLASLIEKALENLSIEECEQLLNIYKKIINTR